MYWKYAKERENVEVLEWPQGFISFKFFDQNVYLKDIYVLPEYRRQNFGMQLLAAVEDIARGRDYKYVTGSCVPSAEGSTNSLQAMLSQGFKLLSATEDMIYLKKDL